MSRYLVDRIEGHANIEVLTRAQISGLEGRDGILEAVRWRLGTSGQEVRRPIRHLFLFIGAEPNTDWLAGSAVALDAKGFVLTGEDAGRDRHPLETNRRGGLCHWRCPLEIHQARCCGRRRGRTGRCSAAFLFGRNPVRCGFRAAGANPATFGIGCPAQPWGLTQSLRMGSSQTGRSVSERHPWDGLKTASLASPNRADRGSHWNSHASSASPH
jgi:hypothetical protein